MGSWRRFLYFGKFVDFCGVDIAQFTPRVRRMRLGGSLALPFFCCARPRPLWGRGGYDHLVLRSGLLALVSGCSGGGVPFFSTPRGEGWRIKPLNFQQRPRSDATSEEVLPIGIFFT